MATEAEIQFRRQRRKLNDAIYRRTEVYDALVDVTREAMSHVLDAIDASVDQRVKAGRALSGYWTSQRALADREVRQRRAAEEAAERDAKLQRRMRILRGKGGVA